MEEGFVTIASSRAWGPRAVTAMMGHEWRLASWRGWGVVVHLTKADREGLTCMEGGGLIRATLMISIYVCGEGAHVHATHNWNR